MHQTGSSSVSSRFVFALWGSEAHDYRSRIGCERWGLSFSGPVGLAAGFDKDGIVLPGLAALGFHFVEAGTVTPRPQPGNERPRLFRLPEHHALVNRMGFNNKGAANLRRHLDAFHTHFPLLPSGSPRFPMPVGVNIGKNKDTPPEHTIDDYIACIEAIYPRGDYYAVNISSPNTPGLRDLQTGTFVRELLVSLQDRLRQLGAWSVSGAPDASPSRKPLLLKIAPDLHEEDLEDILEAALATELDGIIVANTWPHPDGGLSGLPLKQWSNRLVAAVYRRVGNRLPIIGVGGIASAEDVYERIKAGAALTQLYTGFIYEGPGLIARISRSLATMLERDGFRHIDDAVGVEADAHPDPWAADDGRPAAQALRPLAGKA